MDGHYHSRRKVLSAIGGVLATSPAGVAIGKTSTENTPSRTQVLTGTPGDPVSRSEVQSAQNELLSGDVTTVTDRSIGMIGAPSFELEDSYVSFYVAKVGEDGKPIAHIGYGSYKNGERPSSNIQASNSLSKERTSTNDEHDRAMRVAEDIQSSSTADEYKQRISVNGSTSTTQSVSTQSVSTDSLQDIQIGSEWTSYGIVAAEKERGEGNLYLTAYPLAYTGNTNYSSDLWASTGYYVVQPESYTDGGFRAHNTENLKVEQKMGGGIPDVDFVAATRPSGDKNGRVTSKSVALTATSDGGAESTVSWTYSQPKVHREEQTNTTNDEDQAAWKYDVQSEAGDENLQFKLGSMHWLEDAPGCSDSNLQWNVGETDLKATFDSPYALPNTYEISANWFGYVCP